MPKLKSLFTAGKMNKDVDSRLLPPGEYRDALNIKVSSSSGADAGVIENCLSNEALTALSLGSTVNTIGLFADTSGDMIYWFVTSDTGDFVIEYDTIGNSATIVLQDTSINVLNFDADYLITGAGIVIDSDNDARYLTWVDDLNPPRFINIERAKTYGANNFGQAEISLMKAAPLAPPTIELTSTVSDEENSIADRFLRFAYRFKYLDGEISALSPFTETAFLPLNFAYDYAISSNESMINQFNQVNITFDTGSDLVTDIELVFKESGTSTVWSIGTFNKSLESWADNSDQVFNFLNNKVYIPLPDDQLGRLFDNVPLKAKALELIGNRIILANFTENYNIHRPSGTPLKIDYSLALNTTAITEGTPTPSLKSNRNYEIGIVYMDDFGRMSTVLTSGTNTVFIPNSECVSQSKIEVTIASLAPYWATRYRLFIKQSRVDYETIVPSRFYQDGVYVWIKVEGDEASKFSVGDFLYVKAGSDQVLDTALQVRVLEVATKEENFLEDPEVVITTVEQEAGTYFKIKPNGFRLNEEDFTQFDNNSKGFRSNSESNNFDNDTTYYVEPPVYYGTAGLDDLTISGTYSGTEDIRYLIEITVVGATDEFRWSDDNGATWSASTPITGGAQPMNNGISANFGFATGHISTDNWVASAKSGDVTIAARESEAGGTAGTNARRAILSYAGKSVNDTGGETISGGAVITISYDDTSSSASGTELNYTQTFVASQTYANIEEWFFGDNILDTLTYPTASEPERVIFRRGNQFKNDPPERVNVDPAGDQIIMVFMTSTHFSGGQQVQAFGSISILELENPVIFETIPENDNSELFYEIGRTYDINGSGHHQGFDVSDQNQSGVQDAILILPVFNCFAWGNGFESYKIKDLFNENSMKIDSRPSGVVNNYKENVRIADLTYSKGFEQSTNFNGLNEFNLSTGNFKQLDDRYGSIQKLYSEDTNLIVFQEDKVLNVPFEKDILFDADGNGTLRESTNVLGTARPYAGEYGISLNPESFCVYGNAKYFSDSRRGAWLRLSLDGITEISMYGMKDFFRDFFRDNPSARAFGAFDLHDKEVVMYLDGSTDYTLSFDEAVKGFPSFYSFAPDFMGSLNNKFYTVKNGQLYRHYDESNSTRNEFYGTEYDSTMKFILNEAPSDIKVVKALSIEGNKAWAATLKSYLNDETVSITESDILVSEYINREGKWDAYVRRSDVSGDLSAKNAYGIGQVDSVTTSVITMENSISTNSLAIGDNIYNSSNVLIGEVTAYDKDAGTITVDTTPTIPSGTFIYGLKNATIEGSEIRGYNFEIDLTDESNTRTELFAVGIEAFKSFPS